MPRLVESELPTSTRATERSVHDRELGCVLETAVVRLPDEYRQVFSLRELAGLSTEETAEASAPRT